MVSRRYLGEVIEARSAVLVIDYVTT